MFTALPLVLMVNLILVKLVQSLVLYPLLSLICFTFDFSLISLKICASPNEFWCCYKCATEDKTEQTAFPTAKLKNLRKGDRRTF